MTHAELIVALQTKSYESGIKAREIADKTCLSFKTVYNILNGKDCKLESFLKVCEFLDLNVRIEEYPPEH